MKIIVLQDYLRSGGTERQSILLANAFAAAGHGTTLLTFRPGGRLAGTVAPAVTRASLQPLDLGLDWFAPRLHAFVGRAEPDVVLCMGRMANCYSGGLQALLAPQSPSAAVIATMRTGKKLPWLFRRSLRRVRHVVANSRDARDTLLREHRLSAENVSVIYNSLVFPAESSLTRNEALRAAQGATASTVVMVCVAMFRPEKNQRELIEIVAGLSTETDWQLWLAGDGPTRRACERLAAERGLLGRRVKFVGFHRDPTPLYRAADLAVHASWSESLSNFLIEGQAHGLPAVAYEAQGINECFVPERTGWSVPAGDRDVFRATLHQRLSESAEMRAARAAEARSAARRTFDPERQAAAYLALFARVQ